MTHPLSFTQIKTFKRCGYKYDVMYNRGIERATTGLKLAEGDFIHRLLAAMYNALRDPTQDDWKDVWEDIKSEYANAQLFEEDAEEVEGLAERVFNIVARYEREVFLKHDSELEVLHLEEELPVMYQGITFVIKPDLVVRDKQGNVWLIDHKTKRDFEEDAEERLRYDDQVSLYLWGLRELGYNVVGAYHNFIRTRLPRRPPLTQKGLLSRQLITTDEQTVRDTVAAYRAEGKVVTDADLEGFLLTMKMSRFLWRVPTFRADDVLDKLASEYVIARETMDWHAGRGEWPRTFNETCARCPVRELCLAELMGGDVDALMQTTFKKRGEHRDESRHMTEEEAA